MNSKDQLEFRPVIRGRPNGRWPEFSILYSNIKINNGISLTNTRIKLVALFLKFLFRSSLWHVWLFQILTFVNFNEEFIDNTTLLTPQNAFIVFMQPLNLHLIYWNVHAFWKCMGFDFDAYVVINRKLVVWNYNKIFRNEVKIENFTFSDFNLILWCSICEQ
jgi:hypothetical protein